MGLAVAWAVLQAFSRGSRGFWHILGLKSPRLCGVDTYEENGVHLYEEKVYLVSISL